MLDMPLANIYPNSFKGNMKPESCTSNNEERSFIQYKQKNIMVRMVHPDPSTFWGIDD